MRINKLNSRKLPKIKCFNCNKRMGVQRESDINGCQAIELECWKCGSWCNLRYRGSDSQLFSVYWCYKN